MHLWTTFVYNSIYRWGLISVFGHTFPAYWFTWFALVIKVVKVLHFFTLNKEIVNTYLTLSSFYQNCWFLLNSAGAYPRCHEAKAEYNLDNLRNIYTFTLRHIPLDKIEFPVNFTCIFYEFMEKETTNSTSFMEKNALPKSEKGLPFTKAVLWFALSTHINMVTGFILTLGPACVEFACSLFVCFPAFSTGTQVSPHSPKTYM